MAKPKDLISKVQTPAKEAPRAPRPHKKKIIMELPDPWGNVSKNKLTPRQIETMLSDQQEDYKWMTKNIQPLFAKRIMANIETRDRIFKQNVDFQNRSVNKTYYSYALRSVRHYDHILNMFFHKPTFTIFTVHKSGISRHFLNHTENEDDFVPIPFTNSVKDAAIDKLSGRVFCLLGDWSITVFEHGFFSIPFPLNVSRPLVHQEKYIRTDKLGHLWLINSHKKALYLLDSLCFSVLYKYEIPLSDQTKIGDFFPVITKQQLLRFYVTSKSSNKLFVFSSKIAPVATLSAHNKVPPKLFVNSNFLITYGKDKKVVIYTRINDKLNELRALVFNSIPTCIGFLKGFKLLVVGLADSTLNLITTTNEVYQINMSVRSFPSDQQYYAHNVIGPQISTISNSMYSTVLKIRLLAQPVSVQTIQYSDDSGLIIVHINSDDILQFYITKRYLKVKCKHYDALPIPATVGSPKIYTQTLCDSELSYIQTAINKTRNQLTRDGLFLKQINAELERRFITYRFKCDQAASVAHVLVQSPYRRWLPWLFFCKNKISIYEIAHFMSFLDISCMKRPYELTSFISKKMCIKEPERVGLTSTTISLSFEPSQVNKAIEILCNTFLGYLFEFVDMRDDIQKKENTVSAVFLKNYIHQYQKSVLHNLSEIENIVKNQIRTNYLRQNLLKQKCRPKYKLKIPEINGEASAPFFNPKFIQKSQLLFPNPLIECFIYKPIREQYLTPDQIVYCGYADIYEAAKVIPLESGHISLSEITIARPLARMSMANDIGAISNDCSKLVLQYPLGQVPMTYVLNTRPFIDGKSANIVVARFWLSQVLMLMASLHEKNIVVRTIMPSNLLVTNDGTNVQIYTLADSLFPGEDKDKPLPFNHSSSPWIPPEHYSNQPVTSAFDVFQFGVLLLYTLIGETPQAFGSTLEAHMKFSSGKTLEEVANSDRFYYDPFDGIDVSKYPYFSATNAELKAYLDIECSSSFYHVCLSCLDIDPARRPTAKQLLDLPFFNLTQLLVKRARTHGYNILRSVKLPIFVDSVFGTLFNFIEDELRNDSTNVPSLRIAVNILNYFLNSASSGVQISFPVEDRAMPEIIEEVFRQKIFDKIVSYVVNRLYLRFERELKIESDEPFLNIVSLFHQFFRSCIDNTVLFPKVLSSFTYLATGISMEIDSHRLFQFLHHQLRPIVEFFYIKTPPRIRKSLGVSEFYCEHFMQFYDNTRDFSEAFFEESQRRMSAAIEFWDDFIMAYQNEDTFKLLDVFQIAHKVEHVLVFSFHRLRLAAVRFLSHFVSHKDFYPMFFDKFVFNMMPVLLESPIQPYEEKLTLLYFIQNLLLSGAIHGIFGMLVFDVFESIYMCCEIRADNDYLVWGQHEEVPVYQAARKFFGILVTKANPIIVSTILANLKYLRYSEVKKKMTFEEAVEKLENNEVEDSLVSTLRVAENSLVESIIGITCQSKDEFNGSLTMVAEYLMRSNFKKLELAQSLFIIWDNHDFPIHEKLLEFFIERMDMQVLLLALKFIATKQLPDFFYKVPLQWLNQTKREYEEIQKMIKSRAYDTLIIENYAAKRSERTEFLKLIIKHNDKKLIQVLEKNDFASFITFHMLPDVNKFEINLRVVPPSFAKYNRTYPIRSEALTFIKMIAENRTQCMTLFYYIVQQIKHAGILSKEAELVTKIADPAFRKTSIHLLNILDQADAPFKLSQTIMKSELLMAMKDEEINDWENFEIMRKAWRQIQPKSIDHTKRVRPIYDVI